VKPAISRHGATGPAPGDQQLRAHGILIFLHLPKTAGSTFRRILERQYGSDAVLGLYESTFGDEVARLTPEQMGSTRVLAGHFYFGVHHHLPGPWSYLTFLRDPVERVISHYHFVRRQPEHYLYEAASAMSVSEYVRFCGQAEPNNDQTRLLAGAAMASGDGMSAPAMLPAAKRNLDCLAAVGLTEAFDASLVLMRRVFGWRRPFYVRQNVRDQRSGIQAVTADEREVIGTYNALDVELYRHACERFRRDRAALGDVFAREVRMFSGLNALYGRLQGVRSTRVRRFGGVHP
jgi:Galactose-3-O-sulfotransferase